MPVWLCKWCRQLLYLAFPTTIQAPCWFFSLGRPEMSSQTIKASAHDELMLSALQRRTMNQTAEASLSVRHRGCPMSADVAQYIRVSVRWRRRWRLRITALCSAANCVQLSGFALYAKPAAPTQAHTPASQVPPSAAAAAAVSPSNANAAADESAEDGLPPDESAAHAKPASVQRSRREGPPPQTPTVQAAEASSQKPQEASAGTADQDSFAEQVR